MKIYFGQAEKDDDTANLDLFEGKNGKHFYYELEANDDEVSIKDSVGRYVPVEIDNISHLINALSYIRDSTRTKYITSKYLGKALDSLASVYSLESVRG